MSSVRKTGIVVGALLGLCVADRLVTKLEGEYVVREVGDGQYMFNSVKTAKKTKQYILDLFEKQGFVSLADFKDIIAREAAYLETEMGWKKHDDLSNIIIRKTLTGRYIMILPEMEVI